jgi:hypothetical protein
VLLSSGDSFPHLIQKPRSQLGFVTYLLNYLRTFFLYTYVLSGNMSAHHFLNCVRKFTNSVMVYGWTRCLRYSDGDSEYGDVLSSLSTSGRRLCLNKDSAELPWFSSFIECNSVNICQKATCFMQTLFNRLYFAERIAVFMTVRVGVGRREHSTVVTLRLHTLTCAFFSYNVLPLLAA